MVDWQSFDAARYNLEFNEEKLAAHGVTAYEAAEVLLNGVMVRKNKSTGRDRYQVVGCTDAGRVLKLIVHVKGKRTLRVITGWQL
jgi:uncharacterized DUF497 family protein